MSWKRLRLFLIQFLAQLVCLLGVVVVAFDLRFEVLSGMRREAQSWVVQIVANGTSVEEQEQLVTSAVERTFRSIHGLEHMSFITNRDRVFVYFLSSAGTSVDQVRDEVQSKLAMMRSLPGLSEIEYEFFNKELLRPFEGEKGERRALRSYSTEMLALHEKVVLFGEGGLLSDGKHVFAAIQDDAKIVFQESGGYRTSQFIKDRVLPELANIEGIQNVFASNLRFPTLEVRYDSALLLRNKDTPYAVHERIVNALGLEITGKQTEFGKSQSFFELGIERPRELSQLAILSGDGVERRLGEIAMIEPSMAVYPIVLPKSNLKFLSTFLPVTSQDNGLRTVSVTFAHGANPSKVLRLLEERMALLTSRNGEVKYELVDRSNNSILKLIPLSVFVLCMILVSLNNANAGVLRKFLAQLAYAVSFYMLFNVTFMLGNQLLPWMLIGIGAVLSFFAAILEHEPRATYSEESLLGRPMFGVFLLLSVGALYAATFIQPSFIRDMQLLYGFMFGALSTAYAYFMGRHDCESSKIELVAGEGNRRILIALNIACAGFFMVSLMANQVVRFFVAQADRVTLQVVAERSTKHEALIRFQDQAHRLNMFSEAEITSLRPTYSRRHKLALTENGLVLSSPSEISKIVAGVRPQALGWISNLENGSFVLVRGSDTNFNTTGKQLSPESIHQWLSSAALPSRSNSSLESVLEYSLVPSLDQNVSTVEGNVSYSEVVVKDDTALDIAELETNMNALSRELGLFSHSTVRSMRNLVDERRGDANSFMFVVGFVFFFVGVVYFRSTWHAILTAVTFMAFNLFINTALSAVSSLPFVSSVAAGDELALFANWMAVAMLSLWAVQLSVSEGIRRANKSLEESLELAHSCDALVRKGALRVLAAEALISVFWQPAIPLFIASLCCYFISGGIMTEWIRFWVYVSESIERQRLKLLVRWAGQLVLLLLLSSSVFVTAAYADTVTSSSNSECGSLVTVVLPIVGRPKGHEPPPQRAFLSERLAQETPCSWYDSSLLEPLSDILRLNRQSASQGNLVEEISKFVDEQRGVIEEQARERFKRFFNGREFEVRIYAGFFEEFFGNISFTVLDFRTGSAVAVIKRTVAEANQTEGMALIADSLKDESGEIFDAFLHAHERIPIHLQKVESQDNHPLSENLAEEIDLFVRSRLQFPLEKRFFERKPFFRLATSATDARYSTSIRVRRDGIKFYASIVVLSNTDQKRRTAWLEGDLTQLPDFEEELLRVAQKNWAAMEGIYDYGVVAGPEILYSGADQLRFATLSFRQNRGNVAFSTRVRTGTKKFQDDEPAQRVFLVGGAAGWQFFDFRWLSADAGVGLDIGFTAQNFKTAAQERSILVSYGPYMQAQTILTKSFTVLGRIGLEQPEQIKVKKETTLIKFSPYYFGAMVGGGVSF